MKKLRISRKDLKNNLKIVRQILNTRGKDDNGNFPRIIAVVKGNGMGLGLTEYAKFLVSQGIDFLAVANLEEAISLREAGVQEEILMLTPIAQEKEIAKLLENKVTLTISSLAQIELVEKVAGQMDGKVRTHIKIDTGFGRYGFLYQNLADILEGFKMCDRIEICGMYTHFAKPMEESFTRKQFNRFLGVVEFLKKEGQDFGILHVSESTAILKYPMMNLNAVRLRVDFAGQNADRGFWFKENWTISK